LVSLFWSPLEGSGFRDFGLPACTILSVYRTAADNRLTTGGPERILKLVILFLGISKMMKMMMMMMMKV